MSALFDKQKLALLHLLGFPDVPMYSDVETLRLSVPLEKWRGSLKKTELPQIPLTDAEKEASITRANFAKTARILQELIILEIVHTKLPEVHAAFRKFVYVPEADLWNTMQTSDPAARVLNNYTNRDFKRHLGNSEIIPGSNIRLPCQQTQNRFKSHGQFTQQYDKFKRKIFEMLNRQVFHVDQLTSLQFDAESKSEDADGLAAFLGPEEPTLDPTNLVPSLIAFLLDMYKPVTYPQQEKDVRIPEQKLCTLLHRLVCNRDFILVRSLTEVDNSQLGLLSKFASAETDFARIARLSLIIEYVLFDKNISTTGAYDFKYGISNIKTSFEADYKNVLYWLARNCQGGFSFFLYPSSAAPRASTDDRQKITAFEMPQVFDILQTFVYKAFRGNASQKDMAKRFFLTTTKPERYAVSNHIFQN